MRQKYGHRSDWDFLLTQVEGVLQRAARREDKTERLKREQLARDAVLSLYANRFADPVGVLSPDSHARR